MPVLPVAVVVPGTDLTLGRSMVSSAPFLRPLILILRTVVLLI
jgi:hypothetical protein